MRLPKPKRRHKVNLISVTMTPVAGDGLIGALADAHSALSERADARGVKNKADRAATEKDRGAAEFMAWAIARLGAAKDV